MIKRLSAAMMICSVMFASACAQTSNPAPSSPAPRNAFPAAVLSAKTVAVVNDTRDPGVTKGAETALQSWGQFTVVDDPSAADITLRFDKTRERSGTSTQGTDPNTSKPDYGYSVSISSSIHMHAYTRDGDAPFYATKTDDSKAKAGMSCVNDFHTAYRTARQQAKP